MQRAPKAAVSWTAIRVLLHMRAHGDSPVSWQWHTCGGEHWLSCALEHGPSTEGGPLCRWSSRLGPSIGAQISTRAKASARPGHLVHQTGTKTTKDRNCDKNSTLKDYAVKAFGTRAVRPFSEDMSVYLLSACQRSAHLQVGRSRVVDIYLGGGG